MKQRILTVLLALLVLPMCLLAQEDDARLMGLGDVFNLEYVNSPQLSPDGNHVVYVRHFYDIMSDRRMGNLWIARHDGSANYPLTTGNFAHGSPRWSPDGTKVLYTSNESGKPQLYLHWLDGGHTAKLTNLTSSPGSIRWSPDGRWIAFTAFVPDKPSSGAAIPTPPPGAKWAKPAKYIDELNYRADGAGFLPAGTRQLFVLSADGGTPRQLTFPPYSHGAPPAWSADSKALYFSANRHDNFELEPLNSEIYRLTLADGAISALTDRNGPDSSPVVSADGKKIAYLGFDDQLQGYTVTKLYVMNSDGTGKKLVTDKLDRSAGQPQWAADGKGIYFTYNDKGNGKLAYTTLSGKVKVLTGNVGGTTLGRPYSSGAYTVAANGNYAFTMSTPSHPADLAVGNAKQSGTRRLTRLNDDLFAHKQLGAVEEVWWESSFDQRQVQGWICKPPNFDPNKKYPLLLEIHGGPFANYGDRFSAEVQLYAAAGYVVLYTNPRGSTSYGQEFGNLIHHNYPGEDYDDLMSGVDAVIDKGYVDADRLFVTGGSGGGVLSAWIVGKTDRFKAAVVAKPVINWYSFVLTADGPGFFYKYWFPGYPWEHQEQYMRRSPLSLVGNVTTPTMLLTGEVDYRTPISETEQYYTALKLRQVKTAMVRIPEAGHGIAARPSYLMAKVANILKWFADHDKAKE